jgi:peptidoglycan hydrolase-like protein with peptidoglycan-binding domain
MDKTSTANPVPNFMECGTSGPVVNAWLLALKVWSRGRNMQFTGLVFDGIFGSRGVALTKIFQQCEGLFADGGVGPVTRAKFQEVTGVSFEELANAFPGTTIFVQPDSSEVSWTSPADLKAANVEAPAAA